MNGIKAFQAVHWMSHPAEQSVLTQLGVHYGFVDLSQSAAKTDLLKTMHHVRQVHGSTIVAAEQEATGPSVQDSLRPEADGLYVCEPGLRIAIKTADCLPLLLCTATKSVAMVLHAGWRGICAGIVSKGVQHLRKISGEEKVCVVLGPSICGFHYEVGPELVEALLTKESGLADSKDIGLCLQKGRTDRWQLDIASAALLILLEEGVEPQHISVLSSCTYDKWSSYRRDGIKSGRVWSYLSL